MMLLRMYLSPLSKDDDGEIEEQEETTVEGANYSPSTDGDLGTSLGLGATLGSSSETSETEEKPKRTRRKRTTTTRRKKTTEVASVDDNLTMNIPD